MKPGNNVLLIWPESGFGYYNFNPLNDIFGLKGQFFPLPLLYVAAALGSKWKFTLIDTGINRLSTELIVQADFVMISVNILQRESAESIIAAVHQLGKPIIVGGPITSTLPHVFEKFNVTKVVGEIESVEASPMSMGETIAETLCSDMEKGSLRQTYQAAGHPDIRKFSPPRYDLIDPKRYFNLTIQTSRGCHHYCDFCQEVPLYGGHQRKNSTQVIDELDAVLRLGERKSIYIIDDNFMGNIAIPAIKTEFIDLLESIEAWQHRHNFPFDFFCQCSLEVAEHDDIVDRMVRIGLNMLFIGIESVDESSLESVHKQQNLSKNMVEKVRKLQRAGMGVFAGMILGFDNDSEETIRKQTEFIRLSNIPLAGISLLMAFPGTKLFKRYSEGFRISSDPDALTRSFRSNVIFRQPPPELYRLYLLFSKTIYRPDTYFDRCLRWISGWNDAFVLPGKNGSISVNLYVARILRSIFLQGCTSSYRIAYWKYLFRVLFHFRFNPNKLALGFYLGYYYRVVDNVIRRMESFVQDLPAELTDEWEQRFGSPHKN